MNYRKKRRRLAKRVPEREHISTALKADLEKAKKKRYATSLLKCLFL